MSRATPKGSTKFYDFRAVRPAQCLEKSRGSRVAQGMSAEGLGRLWQLRHLHRTRLVGLAWIAALGWKPRSPGSPGASPNGCCSLVPFRPTSGLVGAAGFEPTTCSTQNCRATRLRYTPNVRRAPSIHASQSASKPSKGASKLPKDRQDGGNGPANSPCPPTCCRTAGGRRGRRRGCHIFAPSPPPPPERPARAPWMR
jgi:hypothetical protein